MSEATKAHIINSLSKGIRFDRRKTDEFREVVVETGVSKSAEGSARVKIGETELLVGIKMAVEKPYPDTSDRGNLMVNVELLPMSNPEFESGPPGIKAIEIARVVDRGVRESGAIDVKKLCIEEGEKVWSVMIDICTINAAGNILDAAALGAIAALKDARFPKYEDDKIDYMEKTKEPLPLNKVPVAVTVHKIGEQMIVDPLEDEEKSSDARLTVTTNEQDIVCSLQKGGDSPLTVDEIDNMVALAQKKSKELRSKL